MNTNINNVIQIIDSFIKKEKKELDSIDFVIGISRGGLIPAAWLSTKIIKPLVAAYIDKQDNVYFDRKEWIINKNVLIVDDICRSGKTLCKISKLIEKSNPKSIKIFTIYDIPSIRKDEYKKYLINKLKPGEKLNEDIILPWDFD